MPLTKKQVKERTAIRALTEILFIHRTEIDESGGNANVVFWIDQTIDEVEIGFLKLQPDGDNQEKLALEGHTLTFEEALKECVTRLENSDYTHAL